MRKHADEHPRELERRAADLHVQDAGSGRAARRGYGHGLVGMHERVKVHVRAGFRLILELSERELEVLAKLGLRDRLQASSRPGAVSPE